MEKMGKKYYSKEEAMRIDRRRSRCVCPKCSHRVLRIKGQKCGKCIVCGTQMK